MRLCIVSEYFDETGSTPTILSNLTGYLRRQYPRMSIDVIASRNLYRGSDRRISGRTEDGIDIIRLNTPKSNRPSTLLRLLSGMVFTLAATLRLLVRGRYDVVLVVSNPPAAPIAARMLSRIRGTPYVYLVHDLYPDVAMALGVLSEDQAGARVLRRLQRSWLKSAAKVVVLGRCMRDYLKKNYGVSADRIAVITNWADPAEIVGSPASDWRAQRNLEGVVALYAGNFGHYQDFSDLLDAAALLRDTAPGISIVLVGGGARDAEIKRRVAQENLTNVKVFPLVSVKEYPDVLAAADIALITLAKGAEGVGVPGKFYNVLASERPVVAVVAVNSEVALVLHEDDCGVQVPHGAPQQLASVIRDLASDGERRRRLGHNARQALLRRFTLQQVGDQFWTLFNEVS